MYSNNFKYLEYKDYVLKNLEYQENDVVFFGGSVIENIGNRYSDLDVYILKKDIEKIDIKKLAYSINNMKIQFMEVKDMSCDIEYWSLDEFELLINKIDKIDLNNINVRTINQIIINNNNIYEYKSLLHRFINSLPVYNEIKYLDLKKSFNFKKYTKLIIRLHINEVDNIYTDVRGNLEVGRYRTALISARKMLCEILMAFIYSEGYSIDNNKWLYEKLKPISEFNNNNKNIVDKFIELYYFANIKNDCDIKTNIEYIMDYVNDVVRIIEDKNGGY